MHGREQEKNRSIDFEELATSFGYSAILESKNKDELTHHEGMTLEVYDELVKHVEQEVLKMRDELIGESRQDLLDGISENVEATEAHIDELSRMSPLDFWKFGQSTVSAFHEASIA